MSTEEKIEKVEEILKGEEFYLGVNIDDVIYTDINHLSTSDMVQMMDGMLDSIKEKAGIDREIILEILAEGDE